MPVSGSTIVRRQLGRRLRRLRDTAGKTERDVEEATIASRAKLWRIESGKVPVKVADVRALCWLYGADQRTTDSLATLALGTTTQGWWEDYGDVLPGWFSLYLGLEAAASEMRLYDPELIHGLLQTPDYVRAIHRASNPDVDEESVARQVKLRIERQQSLTSRVPPLELTAVLGAGVLARPVGGPEAMADQITHLKALSALDSVEIRVLPWHVGEHAAMVGAFTLMDFDDPDDPSVAYVETQTGARYLERVEELIEYRRIFDLVYRKTVPLEEYCDESASRMEEVNAVRRKRGPVRRGGPARR